MTGTFVYCRGLKRAQTATEYLIILAVVIVIAMIVIGVLGGIPSIGGGASESSAKLQLASLKVGITNYKQDSHSTLLQFTNNDPTTIRIDEMWINDKKCTLYPYKAILQQGQTKKITCYGVVGLDEGTRFDYDFNLTYTDLATNAQYVIDPDVELVGKIAEGSELHTGQTGCYQLDDGNYGDTPIDCSASNAGGEAKYDGTAKLFTDMGDNVIKDEHTGLYWTTNESTSITREDAITYCDGLTQGGSSSWRLPNIVELTTVMNSGTTGNPTPNGQWVSGAANYWSSTSQSDPYYWILSVVDGYFSSWRQGSDFAINAVCVRGTTTGITLSDGEKSFVDVGDGTVIDTDTGLVWEKGVSANTMEWNESITYCDNRTTGNFTDWRLPTAIELVMLIDYSKSDYRNSNMDWGAGRYHYASTTCPIETGFAYYIDMDEGMIDSDNGAGKSISYAARCVRDH